MKKGFALIALVILASIVAGGIGFFVYRTQQKNPTKSMTHVSEINNVQQNKISSNQIGNSIKKNDSDKHAFGSCKVLIYGGKVDESINFVFIPPRDTQSEETLRKSLLALFDEKEKYSFYSISPYNRHKTDFNFFYLNEYSLDSLSTAKRVLKEKCLGLSENIYQMISLGPTGGGIINNYLKTNIKI